MEWVFGESGGVGFRGGRKGEDERETVCWEGERKEIWAEEEDGDESDD